MRVGRPNKHDEIPSPEQMFFLRKFAPRLRPNIVVSYLSCIFPCLLILRWCVPPNRFVWEGFAPRFRPPKSSFAGHTDFIGRLILQWCIPPNRFVGESTHRNTQNIHKITQTKTPYSISQYITNETHKHIKKERMTHKHTHKHTKKTTQPYTILQQLTNKAHKHTKQAHTNTPTH